MNRVDYLINQYFARLTRPREGRVRRAPHRPTRSVRVKEIDYKVFPDNTIGIIIRTTRGAIYLPPVVREGVQIPLPLKWARGLEKIAPEVVPTPRGVYP